MISVSAISDASNTGKGCREVSGRLLRSFEHVLVREHDKFPAGLGKLAATTSVILALTRARMTDLAFNLDNEPNMLKLKVDTPDPLRAIPHNDLALRARKTTLSAKPKKATFQQVRSAGIDEQLVEKDRTITPAMSQRAQAPSKIVNRHLAVPHCRVDRVLQVVSLAASREVDDRASGGCAREGVDNGSISSAKPRGRAQHTGQSLSTSLSTEHQYLWIYLSETVEPMQVRGGAMTRDSIGTGVDKRTAKLAPEGRNSARKHNRVVADSFEPAGFDPSM